MRKERLLCPGPTPVPPRVSLAISRPVMHHRSPAFRKIVQDVHARLQFLFQTKEDVFFLAGSGTAAMEASVSNTLARGDKALVVEGGKFGQRWGQLCRAYGVEANTYEVEWGTAADAAEVERRLDADPEIKAVLVQASETSTGVGHPIEAISRVTRDRDTLLIVDGITAVAVTDLPFDDWGIDILIAGSQKAIMLPPGLAMGAVSRRAKAAFERSDQPRYYLDLARECAAQAKGSTAYTPAVNLVYGLAEALQMIQEEGLTELFRRHRRLAAATRQGVKAMGLEIFGAASPSPAVTAVLAPAGVDSGDVVTRLRDEHGITIAGGQDHLKGKIFRLSHMGYLDLDDVLAGLTGVGDVLRALGATVDVEAAVGAATVAHQEGA